MSIANSAVSGHFRGISNYGTLTIINSTVTGNHAVFRTLVGLGGGISNAGTLTILNTTLNGNSASGGGGIYNHATLTLINITVSGNSAGGIFVGHGGGIYSSAGTATISNSTITGNSAIYCRPPFCNSGSGGGIAGIVKTQNSIVATALRGKTAMD